MARKTIPVEDLRTRANSYLALSLNTPDERDSQSMRGFRRGVMGLMEHALHETGQYRGFMYLSARHPDMDIPTDDDTLRYYL